MPFGGYHEFQKFHSTSRKNEHFSPRRVYKGPFWYNSLKLTATLPLKILGPKKAPKKVSPEKSSSPMKDCRVQKLVQKLVSREAKTPWNSEKLTDLEAKNWSVVPWNPNDPCFGRIDLQKNRGHLGSRTVNVSPFSDWWGCIFSSSSRYILPETNSKAPDNGLLED